MLANLIGRALALVYGRRRAGRYRDAHVIGVRRLYPDWVKGQTWGEVILLAVDRWEDEQLRAHEYVHVTDWRRYGTFGFLARYIVGYLKAGILHGWREAYRLNYWERRAYGDVNSEDVSA